jgi:uncharacterized Zn finger protein
MGWYYGFKPYVNIAQRRAKAMREMSKLAKKGQKIEPIKIEGRKIADSFWGKAWCENLESYSDFSNRLPRGRTYVRNGSVVDLHIEPGIVTAHVSGSELYKVKIKIRPLADKVWCALRGKCAGQVGSLVELLQGRLSQGVMQLVTHQDGGLFPRPTEIEMNCSCPDGAYMCKHVAAVLYGVGARIDQQPELLFALRKVDHLELLAEAGKAPALRTTGTGVGPTLAADLLSDVFGIEIDTDSPVPPAKPSREPLEKAAKGKAQKPRNGEKNVAKLAPDIAGQRERKKAVISTAAKKRPSNGHRASVARSRKTN